MAKGKTTKLAGALCLKDECGLQNWAYMMSRRETKSQPVADTFSFFGEKNLVKAIMFIGDKVVGKAIANKTCIRNEGKLGSGGLPPGKMIEAMPSRTSENGLLESRI